MSAQSKHPLKIVERFLSYTRINTTSVFEKTTLPSCDGQMELAKLVAAELEALGCVDIHIQDNAITHATLPANCEGMPTICLFAHLDTAPDTITDTHARVVYNYEGGNIPFGGDSKNFIDASKQKALSQFIGDDILISDGLSLLGADDKAAIAAIVNTIETLSTTPDIAHGDIKVVLLPDEETGIRGAKELDVAALKADFGICIDCCGIGEYVIENWYAGNATMQFTGVTAHPMSAKGVLQNALVMAYEVFSQLPATDRPEHTENREGYFWLKSIQGDVAAATVKFDIREFEFEVYQQRKALLQTCVDNINRQYGEGSATLVMHDDYSNVAKGLEQQPEILTLVEESMDKLGIEKKPLIMRGGYDGSVITPKGLTTVNIFTGAYNFHSINEYLPVSSLVASSNLLTQMIKDSKKVTK